MNMYFVYVICVFVLSTFNKNVERTEIQMSSLMEEMYVQLENPENSRIIKFQQARQKAIEYYMDIATYYLSPERLTYWMDEFNNIDKDFKKKQKEFKDYEK